MTALNLTSGSNALRPGQNAPGVITAAQRRAMQRKAKMARPLNSRQAIGQADPSGGVQGPSVAPGSRLAASVANTVQGATTATVGPPAAVQAPKMSAYDRRRKGILDILNDPALAQYNQAYLPNYDAARGNIENAFAQAQGEIASRQAAGQGLLAAMPGQISAAYGDARSGIDASNAALSQAQAAQGVQSYMAPGVATAPVSQALSMEQAAATSNVPTLGVGLSNLASEQRQQTGLDRASALADLATKEEDAKRQYAQDKDQPSWVQQQLIQEQLAAQDAKVKKQTGAYVPGKFEVSTKKGEQVANLRPKHAAMLQSGQGKGGKVYKSVVGKIQGLAGMGPNKQKAALAKIIADARKASPGHETAISLAVYDVLGA